MKKGHRFPRWLLPLTAVVLAILACGVEGKISVTPTIVSPTSISPPSRLSQTCTPMAPPATQIIPTATVLPTKTPAEQPTIARGPYECTNPLGCIELLPKAPIHIAYLLVVEGPNSSLGIDSRNGVEIAIDDAGGTILGHPIKFDGVDGGCNADSGATAGAKLAFDPTIVAVIGPSCSSEARAAVPLLSLAGFVIISPSNTAPDLTDPTSSNYFPGYFRTAANDKVQGVAAAEFAYNILGVRTVATIHDGSLYADKLQQIFAQEFSKLGGTIKSQARIDPDGAQAQSVLTSFATDSPELIYLPIFMPAGAEIIRLAKQTQGLENTRLMGADCLYSPEVMQSAGEEVEGFLVSSPYIEGPAYDAFLTKYIEKFHIQPINIYHTHAYDAFNIIKAAIERAAVQQAAHNMTYIPRQALRDAVAAATDFPGVTGNLTCTPFGDCANPLIGVYEYHAGSYPPKLIWSQKLSP